MLIFKCVFSYNELRALQNYLPADQYCIINKTGEKTFYGLMTEELHSKMMDILSGETLGQLEYVDEEELRKYASESHAELMITGNKDLLPGGI